MDEIVSHKVTVLQAKALMDHWHGISTMDPSTTQHQYMLARDKEYAKWKLANENSKADFIVRLVLSQVDSARAKLANIFTVPQPIFEVVSPPQLAPVANQYTAIYESDSAYYGWKSELSVMFLDGLKYNLCAAEVVWDVEKAHETVSAKQTGGAILQPETKVIYQGNKVKRIDLYNAFWDMTVTPKLVHKEGDYAGYTELYTPSRLHRILNHFDVPQSLRTSIYKSSHIHANGIFSFSSPAIASWLGATTPEDSAAMFDIPEKDISNEKMLRAGTSTVTRIYERIIPNDYGLTEKGGFKNPMAQCVVKFTIVNGKYIIGAEQQTNKHNYFPIVFAQPLDEGLGYQTKSFSHNLEDLQDVASALMTTEIKSSRRMLTDRGIYDPMMLNKWDISSPNPTAKIALRTSALGRNISDAYYPIPYEDRAMGSRIQQVAAMLPFGNEISGNNAVTQGQFVKGNKTNDQFAESMAASGQRFMALAMNLEDSFFSVIKMITSTNIMQFQPPDKALSQHFNQEITLNPTELQTLVPQFKIADGLLPADRIAQTELIGLAMQMIPQMPELALSYNVPNMFVHMLELKGLRNLKDYEYTQQQKDARMKQAQAAQAAQGQQTDSQTPATAQPQG